MPKYTPQYLKEKPPFLSQEDFERWNHLRSKPFSSLDPDTEKWFRDVSRKVRKFRKSQGKESNALKLEKWLQKAPEMFKKDLQKFDQYDRVFCMDLEFCENTDVLTEVGVSIWNRVDGEVNTYHYVVDEFYHLRNSTHVPDNKDNFQFGETERLDLDSVEKKVKELANSCDCFAGHAFKNDKSFLMQCGAETDKPVFDTQHLSCLMLKRAPSESLSLENLCLHFDLSPSYLHNAGNDAYWTVSALKKITIESN